MYFCRLGLADARLWTRGRDRRSSQCATVSPCDFSPSAGGGIATGKDINKDAELFRNSLHSETVHLAVACSLATCSRLSAEQKGKHTQTEMNMLAQLLVLPVSARLLLHPQQQLQCRAFLDRTPAQKSKGGCKDGTASSSRLDKTWIAATRASIT